MSEDLAARVRTALAALAETSPLVRLALGRYSPRTATRADVEALLEAGHVYYSSEDACHVLTEEGDLAYRALDLGI